MAGTKVLMADGSSKPIQDVKLGEDVQNAVPGESKDQHHTVTAIHITDTDTDYTTLVVKSGERTGTITATSHHVFYDLTAQAWVSARDLKSGDQLQMPDGGTATVAAVHNFTQTVRTYNLTVDGLHTYYVDADGISVLVHNAMCPTKAALLAGPHPDDVIYPATDKTTRTSSKSGSTYVMSGSASDVPDGYDRSFPEDTLASLGGDGNYLRVPNYRDNNGGDGTYHLSHAEPQAEVLNPGGTQSVNREMCDVCVLNMGPRATQSGKTIIISDPVAINVFAPGAPPQTVQYPWWFRGKTQEAF